MKRVLWFFSVLALFSGILDVYAETGGPDTATLRRWVQEMKTSERGPFSRIRWFCNDGTVHPPRPYPCEDRGDGVQHGEWNDRTRALRDHGYYLANVLADFPRNDFAAGPDAEEMVKQMVLEQFLISSDNGWILRRARYYRGALQAEDESAGGQALLTALAKDRTWRVSRYTVLREAVRLLPREHSGAPILEMRQLSRGLAEKDAGFERLRVKIHVKPDVRDADRVRAYAMGLADAELAASYKELAATIEQVHRMQQAGPELTAVAAQSGDNALAEGLRTWAGQLTEGQRPEVRLAAAGSLLAVLREYLAETEDGAVALDLLHVTLSLEREVFRAGQELLRKLSRATRRTRIDWLVQSTDAIYGAGLISARQRAEVRTRLIGLTEAPPSLLAVRTELTYLSRLPGWADGWMRFHFGPTVEHMAGIEPLVVAFLHDRLRGSALLFYAAVLESLMDDANGMLRVQHEFFGKGVTGGVRALNPGLGRGALRFRDGSWRTVSFDPEGIYVLPATTADLPAVSGIITAGEGNALSHVQLLARNLGIPNVVINQKHLGSLRRARGRGVVLAVSPRGVVQLSLDGPEWDAVFQEEVLSGAVVIRPDLEKLNLKKRTLISLRRLRASDSGRTVGPKAANLGELKRRFRKAVTKGLVIPFGFFRGLLEQPIEAGGPSVFHWMRDQYALVESVRRDPARRDQIVGQFLDQLRQWIVHADAGEKFRSELRSKMKRTFGPEGSYGVFVRSDTNIEDLPGFTGAGLNLTVPHVVGYEQVLEAISRVWASPFTERAYRWRQAYMKEPEHVYVSVLLMKSVPVEKSGVLVTTDLQLGDPEWATIAVNHGVGGAVEGQGAEELRVNMNTGEHRLMAEATEPFQRVLRREGGISLIPVTHPERVLEDGEIQQLTRLVRRLPKRFPRFRDAEGGSVPADVEFGFLKGRLVLFQIRPFLQSTRARRSRYLHTLDGRLDEGQLRTLDLDGVPRGPS